MLNVKTYFGDSSQSQPNKPRPYDYSFKEWLKVKIWHTNVTNSVQDLVLNEWVLDSFDVEGDYANKFDDPYSRRFDEYKKVFNNEVEQLSNEYILRVGKKGHVLDDVWEKCEQYHDGAIHAWHDERFEKDELWKSGPSIKKLEFEVTLTRNHVDITSLLRIRLSRIHLSASSFEEQSNA
ncbi:hypothetical protein Tco_1015613 [Tanacetum coccineum]|uniref:Uncharacterized protein n=1 Tax=Tanacetum coccineum TaxID=301880 RepID=A0ABQ5FME8_9ASTR